jgi:CRISPR/Cas system-associated exonuclease Cas4 (RecB family)
LKVYDIDLKNVEFWYVRFNKYQNVTVDISLIEKVNNIIEDVRESVKEDKFPKNETNCFFCDYKLICESEKKHNKNRMVNLK